MCSMRQSHQQMCKQELEDDLTEKHQNYPLQSKIEQDEKLFKRRTLQKDGLAGNRNAMNQPGAGNTREGWSWRQLTTDHHSTCA